MKKSTTTLLFSFLAILSISGQQRFTTDEQLERDIIRTGIIHSPLLIDTSKSYEAGELKKNVLYFQKLNLDKINWKISGSGKIINTETTTGDKIAGFTYSTYTGHRAKGSESDPDYATYGHVNFYFDLNSENWEKYNRIVFNIYPACEGARIVNLNVNFENANTTLKEGLNRQSGSHLINLTNYSDNTCFLDLSEYQRDKVKRIGFSVSIKGKDRTTGDNCSYFIKNIELQQIENPETISGWVPGKNKIIYSTSGYLSRDKKTAIINIEKHNNTFELIDTQNNKTAFNGKIKKQKTSTGEFDVLDFSDFNQSGTYSLKVGDYTTPPFQIGKRIWENSLWRVLNFIFCQRCGYPVPGKHGTCHLDLCSKHDGKMISYAGGWHDAGDLSQQTLQTGDVTFALLESYNTQKNKNELLATRMLEEAEWGLEFILRNRYGDGYRASSMGLLIWQDGVSGTLDDISSVRVQNISFDNFLYAGYEAYAALTIGRDPMLQEYLTKVAKEDFRFALEKHEKDGYGGFLHFYEHSYNTSESQYMATVSWAASMLYKLTKDPYYAEKATEFINYTLDCQRKEAVGDNDKIKGFFYRDKTKKVIVHYNHQSREQVYMQAMTILCETQPNHPDYKKWEESIRLYGDYLKSLVKYTAPYGMIVSGVYHIDEPKDEVSFQHSHLFTSGNEAGEFAKQLKYGVQLDKEHYLRRFPVGFGIFNGNNAVLLSMGKAAAICGNFLKDEELLRIGKEQLYWVAGKNPFGQSMIYGEGYNYPQMDTFSSGEMAGEMPVGIRSLGNQDIPYWPPTNNATYKEVWITSAGKWLTLTAEY